MRVCDVTGVWGAENVSCVAPASEVVVNLPTVTIVFQNASLTMSSASPLLLALSAIVGIPSWRVVVIGMDHTYSGTATQFAILSNYQGSSTESQADIAHRLIQATNTTLVAGLSSGPFAVSSVPATCERIDAVLHFCLVTYVTVPCPHPESIAWLRSMAGEATLAGIFAFVLLMLIFIYFCWRKLRSSQLQLVELQAIEAQKGSEPEALPPNWTEELDVNGHKYYFNHETNQSTWDRPGIKFRTSEVR